MDGPPPEHRSPWSNIPRLKHLCAFVMVHAWTLYVLSTFPRRSVLHFDSPAQTLAPYSTHSRPIPFHSIPSHFIPSHRRHAFSCLSLERVNLDTKCLSTQSMYSVAPLCTCHSLALLYEGIKICLHYPISTCVLLFTSSVRPP